MIQTNSLDYALNIKDIFQTVKLGKSMLQTYGSPGDEVYSSSFIMASRLDFTLESLVTGTNGVIHGGVLPYSALNTQDGQPTKFTPRELIKNAGTPCDLTMTRTFGLSGYIHNKAIAGDNSYNNADEIATAVNLENVSFAVVSNAYKKFDNASENATYFINLTTHANLAGFC